MSNNYLPVNEPAKILLTSGASCPDAMVEGVIKKLVNFFPVKKTFDELLKEFE